MNLLPLIEDADRGPLPRRRGHRGGAGDPVAWSGDRAAPLARRQALAPPDRPHARCWRSPSCVDASRRHHGAIGLQPERVEMGTGLSPERRGRGWIDWPSAVGPTPGALGPSARGRSGSSMHELSVALEVCRMAEERLASRASCRDSARSASWWGTMPGSKPTISSSVSRHCWPRRRSAAPARRSRGYPVTSSRLGYLEVDDDGPDD